MNIDKLNEWLNSPGYDDKLTERLGVQQEASENYFKRMEIIARCADDPIFFIENFGWVFEPRNVNQTDIEFFLFDYQKEVIADFRQAEILGEDRLFDKSRDMGFTWLVTWYYLWRWLFSKGWVGLYGSRKQEEVDNKTMNSFFGKLRYGLYRLPNFLFPHGFKKKLNDTENKLTSPELNSLIQGESSNPNFGRDRRSSLAVIDELFLQEYAQDMWRSLAETSKCRIGISTPKPTRFAKSLREGMQTNGWLRSFHWKQHPFKDESWYEKEKKKYLGDELGLRRELELEYMGDQNIFVYPQAELIKIENIEYKKELPLYLSMDWGNAPSKTVFCWWQMINGRWFLLESLASQEKPFGWYLAFLERDVASGKLSTELSTPIDKFKEYIFNKNESDVLSKVRGWGKASFVFGEVAHLQKQITTSASIAQELAKYGIQLRYNSNAISHEKRQLAVKQILANPGLVFCDTYFNRQVLDDLTLAHFPKIQGVKERVAPVHDETADARAAVENFAVNVAPRLGGGKIKEIIYNKRYATAK